MALCEKKETVKYKCFRYNPPYPHNTKCIAKEIEDMAIALGITDDKLSMHVHRCDPDTDEQYADPMILIGIPGVVLITPGDWVVKVESNKTSYPYYKIYSDKEFNDKFNLI